MCLGADLIRPDEGAGEVLASEPFSKWQRRRRGGIEFAVSKGAMRGRELDLSGRTLVVIVVIVVGRGYRIWCI